MKDLYKTIIIIGIACIIGIGGVLYKQKIEEPVNLGATILRERQGGTNQSTYTKGDILWADDTNSLAKLPVGNEDEVLTIGASDVLNWEVGGGGGTVTDQFWYANTDAVSMYASTTLSMVYVSTSEIDFASTTDITISTRLWGDDIIFEPSLSADDAPADEECLTYETATGNFEWQACGTGSPGGSDTYVQFNDATAFGGDSAFTWNKTSDILTVTNVSSTQLTVSEYWGLNTINDTHIDWGAGTNQVDTDDVPEGSNLYYTAARWDTKWDTEMASTTLDVTGTWTYTGDLTVGNVSSTDITIADTLWGTIGSPLLIGSNTSISGDLIVDGNATLTGIVQAEHLTSTDDAQIYDTLTVSDISVWPDALGYSADGSITIVAEGSANHLTLSANDAGTSDIYSVQQLYFRSADNDFTFMHNLYTGTYLRIAVDEEYPQIRGKDEIIHFTRTLGNEPWLEIDLTGSDPIVSSSSDLIVLADNVSTTIDLSTDTTLHAPEICLNGTCETSWPSGGATDQFWYANATGDGMYASTTLDTYITIASSTPEYEYTLIAYGSSTNPDVQMFWNADYGAFRGGYRDGTDWDAGNIGEYSFAYGRHAKASGENSIALGGSSSYETLASGNYSVAMGNRNVASGESSFVAGYNNTANGLKSVALGLNNTASGNYSVAIGATNTSSNTNVAIGFSNINSGDYGAVAMGYGNTLSGNSSVAIGRDNTGAGHYSFVAGYNSNAGNASGDTAAIAMGYYVDALNQHSVAIGTNIEATADGAITLGSGLDQSNPLINSNASSLAIGFSSTTATLAIQDYQTVMEGNASITEDLTIGGTLWGGSPLDIGSAVSSSDDMSVAGDLYANGTLRIPVKTDAGHPSNPVNGDVYLNTSDNYFYGYADGVWRELSANWVGAIPPEQQIYTEEIPKRFNWGWLIIPIFLLEILRVIKYLIHKMKLYEN